MSMVQSFHEMMAEAERHFDVCDDCQDTCHGERDIFLDWAGHRGGFANAHKTIDQALTSNTVWESLGEFQIANLDGHEDFARLQDLLQKLGFHSDENRLQRLVDTLALEDEYWMSDNGYVFSRRA